MSKTFAVADLHGRFDLLTKAIDAIEASSHSGGTVVFTGDYVDRGPESRQVIERLMVGPTTPGWRWVCLKGNHEDMMVMHCAQGAALDLWRMNGGGYTLISYGHPTTGPMDVSVVPKEHIDWIEELPLWHEDAHRLFVHAGVSPEDKALKDQPPETLLWYIYTDDDERGWRGKHVVHGHHQFADGPILLRDRSDFDTFAWATGRLVIGVFNDDLPGGPVSTITVKATPHERYSEAA